jgi:sulfate transport system ATP-binding protein
MNLTLEKVEKSFGRFKAADRVSLEIESGEFITLLGPSGSGKTTLLRILGGLEFPDSGRVLFDGDDVTDRAAGAREVGFVFQNYALFRHLTAAKNIAFGLEVRPRRIRPAPAEIATRVDALLARVGLAGLGARYPTQLSGGQRQRVALARALAIEPRILLLDEPFGALDARVRKELRRWLRALHAELGLTSILVTHDQEEAFELSDRVAVIDAGKLVQVGTPQQVYDAPASPFVHEFLGEANRFGARVAAGQLSIPELRLQIAAPIGLADGPAVAYIRHTDLLPAPAADNDAPRLATVVRDVVPSGATVGVVCQVKDGDATLLAEFDRHLADRHQVGVGRALSLEPRRINSYSTAA